MALISPVRPLTGAASPCLLCPCRGPPHPSVRQLTAVSFVRRLSLSRVTAVRVTSCSSPTGERADKQLDGSCLVDVVGIGSRKDTVIDFCLDSPFASSSRIKFWTIHSREPFRMQLMQKSSGKATDVRNMEFPLSVQSSPPCIILVATAGHGTDDLSALELLNAVKSSGRLAVAIILKPFCFEGQRRLQEVDDFIGKLQKCSQLYSVVETDALLKAEETLAEAIRIVNNAVLLTINLVSALVDDAHPKFLGLPDQQVKELSMIEILKLLGSYVEIRVGYGAGYNIRSSISKAAFNCPFLTTNLKVLDGIVVLNISSAKLMDKLELQEVIHTFQRITQFGKEIIICSGHESGLEPNLIVTSILVLGSSGQAISEKKGFLSDLLGRFPFFSSLLRGISVEEADSFTNTQGNQVNNFALSGADNPVVNVREDSLGNVRSHATEQEAAFKTVRKNNEDKRLRFSEGRHELVQNGIDQTPADYALDDEDFNLEACGPGFQFAQSWAKERTAVSETTSVFETTEVFALPVGVKFRQQFNDEIDLSATGDLNINEEELPKNLRFSVSDSSYSTGPDSAAEMYDSALAFRKGKDFDSVGKQGLLSSRAASMLEVERESERRWTPVLEMEYKGGLYKGKCQGGLPDGKGRLTLNDGSFYEGMWRNGKRSGLGTFCYSNGDMFQGTWRDDFMHGKGWFYFHTGDRWFANFWKGKANGECRFYSKSGSIFFGYFRNGWRDGECLYISSDGTRWREIWEDGVLVNRRKDDASE